MTRVSLPGHHSPLPRAPRRLLLAGALAAVLALALSASPARASGGEGSEQMEFGVRAAKKGLWREALFRWEKAHKLLPDNPRILNNLAVAYETAGEFEKAAAMYKEALRLAPGNRDIQRNHDLFSAYYKQVRARKEREEGRLPPPPAPDSGTRPEETPPDAPPPR